jgi:4-amino-4-deoxy-L-arabinose transferase-like glycosyltransferase
MSLALIAARALGVLKSVPWWVFAAVAGAVALWFAVAAHDRAQFNKGFNVGWAGQHHALLTERQAHAITRASLERALIAVADQNAAIGKLAAEAKARLGASNTAVQNAQKAAATSETIAKALDASASKPGARDPQCIPSDIFINSSGNL